MRQFIRHPSDIPIRYDLGGGDHRHETLKNISHGGLAFRSETFISPGSEITVHIDIHDPPFNATGEVTWCISNGDDSWEIGVEFSERTDFMLRMVEQVCHIEHYKHEVEGNEGRHLTGKEAAAEWIGKYAGKFPE